MTENDNTVFQPQEVEGTTNEEKVTEKKTAKKQWRKVTIGGIGAILLGAGGAYASSIVDADDEASVEIHPEPTVASTAPHATAAAAPSKPQPEPVQSEEPVQEQETAAELPEETDMASVSDDMTFNEAFEAARNEVGPGGVFHWKDGVYSTFNEREWLSLSDEDKNEYALRVRDLTEDGETLVEPDPEDPALAVEEPEPYDDTKSEVAVAESDSDEEPEPGILALEPEPTSGEDDDVRFLGEDPEGSIDEGTIVQVGDEVSDEMLAQYNTEELEPIETLTESADYDTGDLTVNQGLEDDGGIDMSANVTDDIAAI